MNVAKLTKLYYEEVAKCTRCGFCLPDCPTYQVKGIETYTARGRNAITRAVIENKLELTPDLAKALFTCLGCGACTVACFPAIKTKDTVWADRALMAEAQIHPAIMDKLAQTLNEYYNISSDDPEERAEWTELMSDVPAGFLNKDRAEIVYFVGCVASFFPLAQRIPAAMVTVMDKAGLDFTVLGGEEWCCGFPLIGAGRPEDVSKLKEHNLAKVQSLGAQEIVFACPSCFHTWKQFYETEIKLSHASQLLGRLIKEGRFSFKDINLTVTYHDPCDLGRNSGVFEEPREVLQAIPGVTLVEMAKNRRLSVCCGGGGNVEMFDPALSAAVAQMKIDQIMATGARTVVSSCQQCLRTIQTRATRAGITDLKVLDLVQLAALALA
ncbi:MAG: (Fe-S)-binding protein [Thermodesulfobacteriota bacterium]